MKPLTRLDRPAGRTDAPSSALSLTEKVDVCRGVFAFLVVVSHAWAMAALVDPNWNAGLPPAVRDVPGQLLGVAGLNYVMGFFVLSGYCIQGSVRRLSDEGGRFPLRAYLVARLTRVLPLYYLALGFAAAVEAAVAARRPEYWRINLDGETLLHQAALVQGFTRAFGSFAPSWSITNELVYYILFGLVAAVAGASRGRAAVAGLALTIGLGLAFQAAGRAGLSHPSIDKAAMMFGLGSIWFLGALADAHADRLPTIAGLPALARLWPSALAAGTGLILLGARQRTVCLASGLAFTLMIVHFTIQDRAAPRRPARAGRPFAAFLGLVSYPVYLFHGPVLIAFGAVLRWADARPAFWLLFPAATVVSVGCCLPLGRLAERPILAWRARLLKRMRTTPAGGAAPERRPAPAVAAALGAPR